MKTNAEMLKTIIEYAVERGWKGYWHDLPEAGIPCEAYSVESEGVCVYTILFSHPFAKAVFGEKEIERLDYIDLDSPMEDRVMVKLKLWEHYLQQCVISDNPILYYYNFVTERREG